eukprot:6978031-Prymnesium_polylepis.3
MSRRCRRCSESGLRRVGENLGWWVRQRGVWRVQRRGGCRNVQGVKGAARCGVVRTTAPGGHSLACSVPA